MCRIGSMFCEPVSTNIDCGKHNPKFCNNNRNEIYNNYTFLALTEFEIDPDSMENVVIYDDENTLITPELFSVLVPQFLACNKFSIKLIMKSDPNESLLVPVCVIFFKDFVNFYAAHTICSCFFTQELRYYLLKNGGRSIFLEAEHDENGNSGRLSPDSTNFLTEKIMDFIDLKYSIHRWGDVELVCKAATAIFPAISLVCLLNVCKMLHYRQKINISIDIFCVGPAL